MIALAPGKPSKYKENSQLPIHTKHNYLRKCALLHICIKHWWSSEKGRHGHVWIRFSFRFISLINMRLNKTPTILQVRFSNAFSWLIKISMKFDSESQTNTTPALVPLTHLGTISPIPPCDFKRNKEMCDICVSREITVVFTRHKGDTRPRGVNGPLTRYVKLQVAHAPGMPGTFSPAADFKANR